MFEPHLALASLSGHSDAAWARKGAAFAGCAFLGGVALDDATRAAARAMVRRGREEFLPADPAGYIEEQLAAVDRLPLRPAVNVRSTTLEPIREVATICRRYGAILEVNAHCRQDEMCAIGTGEALLQAPERLAAQVEAADGTGADVSVKLRTEVDGVDLPALAARLDDAGASAIHIDAMDSEAMVGEVATLTDCFVIANNGVRDRESVTEYVEHGADAVSVARPSDDPAVLRAVRAAVDAQFAEATP